MEGAAIKPALDIYSDQVNHRSCIEHFMGNKKASIALAFLFNTINA
jgi:hypothetical protein